MDDPQNPVQFLHTDDAAWNEPPGHVRGYSKYLVGQDTGSRYFDFRLSRYPTGGRVDPHVHETAEHVYYFIEGEGTAQSGDETRAVGPGSVLFVRPGVRHAIVATSQDDLVFVVVTSPPTDIPR